MDIEFNYRRNPSRSTEPSRPVLNSVTNLNFLRNLKLSKKPFPSFKKTTSVSLEADYDKSELNNLEKIIDCYSEMTLMQKNVFALKTFENLATQDICKILNISETEFWKYISTARKELIETLYTN